MTFSLRDFAEPGDEYVDFAAGTREVIGSETLEDGTTITFPMLEEKIENLSFEDQTRVMLAVVRAGRK